MRGELVHEGRAKRSQASPRSRYAATCFIALLRGAAAQGVWCSRTGLCPVLLASHQARGVEPEGLVTPGTFGAGTFTLAGAEGCQVPWRVCREVESHPSKMFEDRHAATLWLVLSVSCSCAQRMCICLSRAVRRCFTLRFVPPIAIEIPAKRWCSCLVVVSCTGRQASHAECHRSLEHESSEVPRGPVREAAQA